MIINCNQYAGPCACGQEHRPATQRAIIRAGCMRHLNSFCDAQGRFDRRAAIYDTNTYNAHGLTRPQVAQEIILPAEGLRPDDTAIAAVLGQLAGDTDLLIAIGAGTIHNIVRYCAHKLSIPFIACPTAASVDGFADDHATMIRRGLQVNVPGVAPLLILADLDIIANAPAHLARAGVGDALSKYTALADWAIISLLEDRPICHRIEGMLRQAAVAAQGACTDLAAGNPGAYGQLMYALLLPGLVTQMYGDARPVNGAEHHLSQLMDLLPDRFGPNVPTPHGQLVGACTAALSALYHRLAAIEDIAPYLLEQPAPIDAQALADTFGETAVQALLDRNTPDSLRAVSPDKLRAHWPQIRRILAEVPDSAALDAMLRSAGAKGSLAALGLRDMQVQQMLRLAPCLHNELTPLRMLRMFTFFYASNADASAPPSRKSRYADKAITRAGSKIATSASSM